MSNKILFYIDNWFFHFGIAKHLQKKLTADLYAIIDADEKSNKFFQTQKLIKFQKIWSISDPKLPINKSPDIEFLKSFEEQFKINLWKIAYSDRVFYKFNPHYKFTHDEILYMLEQKCRLYSEIFQNIHPNYFLTFLTVSYHHQLLYEICKAQKIKILMLQPIKFGNRMTISESSTKFDNDVVTNKRKNLQINSFEELNAYLKKFDVYSQDSKLLKDSFESRKIDRYKSNLSFFTSFWDNEYQKRYWNYGRTRSKILAEKISRSRKRKNIQAFLDKHCLRNLDTLKPYVYYPLHYEPERILLIDAPYYDDQLTVIRNIAKSLPVGYFLAVKEHFMMKTLGWRDKSFYKNIMELPNVKLIHPSVPPEKMIKNSALVITIAGTSGQEAAFYQKPTIVLTEQPYSQISSVTTLKHFEDLPNEIRNSLSKKVDINEMTKFLETVEQNSFEINWRNLSNEFAFKFGFKGPVMAAELNESNIEKFLDEHNSEFELLANEHLKKLKQK